MTKGFSYILAAGALLSLGGCASGYVSGYDEIRQHTTAQEPARAQSAPKQATQKQATKKQSVQKQRDQKAARQKSAASQKNTTAKKQQTQSGKARTNRSADQSANTTAALNQAQLNQNRKPAATQRAASATPQPQTKAQAQSVSGGTVTVGPGETLFAISRRTGVELRDLVLANNLEPPYALRAGQRLTIPAARYHIVRAGETGYSISRAYGTDLTTLARLNALEKPYAVQVGQRLRLPASPTLPNGGTARTTVAKAPASAATPTKATPAATKPATQQAAATASASTATTQKPLPAPAAFSGTFSWPLSGRILSRFGPKQGGLHNDGINIAAAQGATVRAAAPGVIAYAGDGLKGFGWLILIKHSDGWVTAYAHNEAVLVKRGDTVRAGEPIARAGSTGSVDRPQLHFEIRNGRRAVDPLKHLPPSPVS